MERVEMTKEENDVLLAKYTAQLNEQQLKALELAQKHLKTSFNIHKSNGYKEWLSKLCCAV